jgi:site-specific DNA-methyltransferase (adenine-specific)
MKAGRNKTIDTDLADGAEYLARCLRLSAPAAAEEVRDRILLGDAFGTLPLLPRGQFDLLIADPPYNLEKQFGDTRFDKMDDEAYEAYTASWLDAALPLLKPGASVYVCCDWASSPAVYAALKRRLKIRSRITWQREKGRGAAKNWKNALEDIWFATCSDDYVFHLDAVRQRRRVLAPYREDGRPKDWEDTPDGRFRDTCPSNFWDDLSVPFWSMAENTAHPTQKPEKLMAKLILASSDPGAWVLDPFAGSGTAAVTAKKLGRHFVAVEREPQFCLWAEQRLERAETDRSIQGYRGGVFWERNAAPGAKG